MGEYEPDDSRNVTQSDHQAPGEPPRTGPREGSTREGEQAREQQEPQAGEARRRSQAEQQERDDVTVNQARGGPIDEDLMTPEGMQHGESAQAGYGNARDEDGRSEAGQRQSQSQSQSQGQRR